MNDKALRRRRHDALTTDAVLGRVHGILTRQGAVLRLVERNDSALVEAVAFGQRAKAFVRWQWQFSWFDEPTD